MPKVEASFRLRVPNRVPNGKGTEMLELDPWVAMRAKS